MLKSGKGAKATKQVTLVNFYDLFETGSEAGDCLKNHAYEYGFESGCWLSRIHTLMIDSYPTYNSNLDEDAPKLVVPTWEEFKKSALQWCKEAKIKPTRVWVTF